MLPSITQQILNWLKASGVKAIAIIKATGRSVVYQTETGIGCSFVPVEAFKKPVTRKPVKASASTYWVVCDSDRRMYTATHQSIELTPVQLASIQQNGGMVFETMERARDEAEALNYPPGVEMRITPLPHKFGERCYFAPRFCQLRIVVAKDF